MVSEILIGLFFYLFLFIFCANFCSVNDLQVVQQVLELPVVLEIQGDPELLH